MAAKPEVPTIERTTAVERASLSPRCSAAFRLERGGGTGLQVPFLEHSAQSPWCWILGSGPRDWRKLRWRRRVEKWAGGFGDS